MSTPEYVRLSPVMLATLRTLAEAGGTMTIWDLRGSVRGCTYRTTQGLFKRDHLIGGPGHRVRLTAAGVAALDAATRKAFDDGFTGPRDEPRPWADAMVEACWDDAHAEYQRRKVPEPYMFSDKVAVASRARPISVWNHREHVVVCTFTTDGVVLTPDEATALTGAISAAWLAARSWPTDGAS